MQCMRECPSGATVCSNYKVMYGNIERVLYYRKPIASKVYIKAPISVKLAQLFSLSSLRLQNGKFK